MQKIFVVCGPTAVGKTKLSIEIAKEFNCEIINADSMQVYKGLDVGTAKVTNEEMENTPHHLLDIKNVEEIYTVFDYQKDCREKIKNIFAKNKNVVIVGGTGLYIKAALFDYEFKEENYLINSYEEYSNEEIYKKIMEINNTIIIDKNNRRRLVRCLNKLENDCFDDKKSSKLLYDNVYFIGLEADREVLYDLINKRVDNMIPTLIPEVRNYYDKKIYSKAIETGIGYKELYPYFANEKTLEECIEDIKKHTRKYAKRQFTWFKNQMDITWFNVNYHNFDLTIKEVFDYLNSK